MRLLAAGFNAHGQLLSNAGPTISTFIEIAHSAPGEPIEVCWAGWSDVVLRIGSRYLWRGLWGEMELQVMATQSGEEDEEALEPLSLHSFFGTHDGCRGAITGESMLFLLPEVSRLSEESLTCTATNLKCTHIAVNGVGRTAVAVAPASELHTEAPPPSTSTTILEFSSLDAFVTYTRHSSISPSPSPPPYTSHTLAHAPLHALHAGQTFHLAHTTSSLSSWAAEPRHSASLGRPTDTPTPCTTPCAVSGFSPPDDDDGTPITKAAACPNGHLAAALTADGSVYIWGNAAPDFPLESAANETTEQNRLALFAVAEADGWTPADGPLPVSIDALPDEDVVDVAVGAAHVVLLERTRGVWIAGSNDEGQLGAGCWVGEDEGEESVGKRGKGRRFWREFRRVDLGAAERERGFRVTGVAGGWYATFLLVEDGD
ncbi:hypothetical protein BKA81DRAFT_429341 [Phyllosticta paracitricarpa]|uniref:Uncharacterized protein n=2 Tax=Phyllosticta TaxID=121621 RepID=A0ABR1MPI2_9PEZI